MQTNYYDLIVYRRYPIVLKVHHKLKFVKYWTSDLTTTCKHWPRKSLFTNIFQFFAFCRSCSRIIIAHHQHFRFHRRKTEYILILNESNR